MFVELHAQSAFTFLEGAEQPEALVEAAAREGMPALVGSEITLADGSRLPLLVEDRDGYRNLCRLITRLKLGAAKGAGRLALDDLAPDAAGLVCLTGGRHGPLAAAVARGDREAARRTLD